MGRRLCTVLFPVYCILMLRLLFDRPGGEADLPYWQQMQEHLNLVPFRTLRLFAGLLNDPRPHLVRAAVVNLAGNVVMFIPLGLLLPGIRRTPISFPGLLCITAGIICAVEILQLISLRGSCDIDDLMLNLIGAGIGYGLFRYLNKETNA